MASMERASAPSSSLLPTSMVSTSSPWATFSAALLRARMGLFKNR